ncbi:hypothetical protein [Thomasclavelia cocleata]|uniref:Uncharacterized protein n=1 Tax=Thomasclavelia cocleata TaxID=69824 RepID=A0A829Z7Y3_9FIRM|nr:hypothetical protein [Thomasclavelia cocleata]GFI40197.1 hypothetical protein IMSAGC017_00228 [Thomasclavelia cocleata]
MNYILKQFDYALLYFSMENTNDGLKVEINLVNKELKSLLPLDLELTNHSLKRWLEKRIISRNRAYVSNFLARLGLNEKDTKGIIDICQGLSLNDCYWIVQENCNDKFSDKIYIQILLIQILLLLLLQDMEVIQETLFVLLLNLQQMVCLQNHGVG